MPRNSAYQSPPHERNLARHRTQSVQEARTSKKGGLHSSAVGLAPRQLAGAGKPPYRGFFDVSNFAQLSEWISSKVYSQLRTAGDCMRVDGTRREGVMSEEAIRRLKLHVAKRLASLQGR